MSRNLTQLRQAVAVLQQGRLAEAIRLSQAILLAEPRNFDALHIVALASYHGRDLATAQRHIEKALAVRQDMPDAYNTQGLILRAAGRPAEAAAAFARAVGLNPRAREAHYNLANCLQDMGRLAQALEHYDQALRIEPGMAMAWNNRGLALRRLGRPADALASFDEAIRRGGDFAPAHYNRADCLAALHRPEEAIGSYDKALALRPDFAEAHCNRANALMELGRAEEALAGYARATSLQPRFHQAHLSRGIALAALGRPAEAEASFRAALALSPDYADAHYNLGRILRELGRHDEAVAAYDAAIRLRPGHAETHSNRANALKDLRRFEDALISYDTAISINPSLAEALSGRGIVQSSMNRHGEALASHDAALQLKPDWAEAHNNRGNALADLNRLDEALASYDVAIGLAPLHALAHANRGKVLRALGRADEALASFDAALALDPKQSGVLYEKSMLLLQMQDFGRGFALHRHRWSALEGDAVQPQTGIPAWDGSPLEGRLLLWGEQGLGDEVFHASMLSLLDLGRLQVTLSADPRLHAIYRRSFPGIELIDRAGTRQVITGDFAAQAAIGDLGHLLQVDAARLAQRRYPYLLADGARSEAIAAANPFFASGPVIGLAWRSGNKKMGEGRSIRLADLAPVLTIPGLRFVNLQYGDVAGDIAEVRERLGIEVHVAQDVDVFADIDGLLSLIGLCDAVLTIDNVTTHLAGAAGKDSVVLAPTGRARHWYWGGEDRSIWYPSLRLVYQAGSGSWAPAIATAAQLLGGRLQGNGQ